MRISLLWFGWLLFAGIVAFQLFNLTTTSLWHDEAFSALLIQYEDYGEMIRRIGLDVHPPLYYMILRVWDGMFGDSLFSLRFFSFLFGLASAGVTFLVAKEIFRNKTLALISAFVLGMNSFQIQYNIEARMYTLGAFFLLVATYVFLRALRTHIPSARFFLYITIYTACAAAALYTHYYTVFALVGHALFGLYFLRFEIKKMFFVGIGFATTALLFVPWLPTFLDQLVQVQESYWIPPITKWSLPTTISKMAVGDGFDPNQAAFLIIVINILVVCALVATLWHYKHREKWALAFLLFMPFAGSVLMSLGTSIYLDRYFVFSLPFLVIMLVAAVLAIPHKYIRFAVLALLLVGTAISYPLHWQSWDLAHKSGMQEASLHMLSSTDSKDIIFVNSSFVYFTFRYYNTSNIHPLLYTPSDLAHFSGTALLNKEDIAGTFDIAKPGSTVWTIDTTGFGNFQPTVPDSWQKQEEKEFPDAYPHRGSIIVRKYHVPN